MTAKSVARHSGASRDGLYLFVIRDLVRASKNKYSTVRGKRQASSTTPTTAIKVLRAGAEAVVLGCGKTCKPIQLVINYSTVMV